MKSDSSSHDVVRRKRPLVPPSRYYPYAIGSVICYLLLPSFAKVREIFNLDCFYSTTVSSAKEDMREVVVGLGIELSLFVAESMFLMCDDIPTLSRFCYKLWRSSTVYDRASERLLRVIYHVYSKDIKPKNGAFQDSVPFQLITSTWNDFCDACIVLDRLVEVLLRFKKASNDDRLLSSAIAQFKQLLKRLEDKLSSAKHVSQANGFAKEMIQSNISHLWKSLFDDELVDLWKPSLFFDDEEEAAQATPNVIRTRILRSLFHPDMGNLRLIQIMRLPTIPRFYSPYILGEDFAMEEMKKEVVQLGVELSVHVAESMFLLCDDTCNMLYFGDRVWGASKNKCVAKCLLDVFHYLTSKYFKPKYRVSQNGPQSVSVHFGLVSKSWDNFVVGIRYLDILALVLGRQYCRIGREYASRVEEALKNVGETLRSARDVSEANGFARDAMEPELLELWKSLFDEETEEEA